MDNTEKPPDYEKELRNIYNALAESVTEATDEDILGEAQESGEDPEVGAKRVREILLGAVGAVAKKTPRRTFQMHEVALERAQTCLYLTEEARRLMRIIARRLGMTQPAMMEILIREKALEMKIDLRPSLPPEN